MLLLMVLGCAQPDDCQRVDADCEAGLKVDQCCPDDQPCFYEFSDGKTIECADDCAAEQEAMTDYCWAARTGTSGCIPESSCCRICSQSKACGDECIAANLNCDERPGCACNAEEVCE